MLERRDVLPALDDIGQQTLDSVNTPRFHQAGVDAAFPDCVDDLGPFDQAEADHLLCPGDAKPKCFFYEFKRRDSDIVCNLCEVGVRHCVRAISITRVVS
jgi:hypothetical protein